MRFIIVIAVLVASRSAIAGVCLSDGELEEYAVQLEATAKSPAKAKELSEFWSGCLHGDQKRKARIVKACTVIVARIDVDKPPRGGEENYDAIKAFEKQVACVNALASYGVNPIKTKTKDIDYIGDQLAKKPAIYNDVTWSFRTLELSGDPRVLPKVIEWYRANLADAAKAPPKGWKAQNWIRWHRAALSIIEKHGTKADLAFLDEVKAHDKDKRVHAWADAARKAIEKR